MPNPTLTLPCPAKLNLFLHVLGRRDNGYHELQTVFQLLNYGDQLHLSSNHSGQISLKPNLPSIPTESNLVFKAAKLLQTSTGTQLGADLTLEKVLPQGGGIGGGSSDAATTLLGLNHLWQTGLSIRQLADLGASLGADVPVFVEGRSAWAEGLGEQLEPMNLPPRWYLVIAPNCSVSTAEIFQHKELTRNTSAINMRAFLEEGGKNDCQPLVEKLYPQVKDAVEWLSLYSSAQLTGTGACVFAAFNCEQEARSIFAKRPKKLKGFVAEGINISPVHQALRV